MTKELKPSSGKEIVFLTNGAGPTGSQLVEECKSIHSYHPAQTKLKSKWSKDLHMKPDTFKLVEEKVGKILEQIVTGKNFLNRTPMAYALRSRIDK